MALIDDNVAIKTLFRLDIPDPGKVIEVYDEIDYVAAGEDINDFVGVLDITGPSGTIYENTDFSNPDIIPATSRKIIPSVALILDPQNDNWPMKGQYTIKYTVRDNVTLNTYEKTFVYGFHFDEPTMDLDVESGPFSGKLRSTDSTDYGSDIDTLTREHRIKYPPLAPGGPYADIVSTAAFVEVDPTYTNEWECSLEVTVEYNQALDDLWYTWYGEVTVEHCVYGSCLSSMYDALDTMYSRYLTYLGVNKAQADLYMERLIRVNSAELLLEIAWREGDTEEADKQATVIHGVLNISGIDGCDPSGSSALVTPCPDWGGTGITPPSYTFQNGLTEVGGVVEAGGALTENTVITAGGYSFTIQGVTGSDEASLVVDPANARTRMEGGDGSYEGRVYAEDAGVVLSHVDIGTPANTKTYNLDSTNGLQEAADYSASYSARTLVAKDYVDAAVAGLQAYTFENGLTESGGTVKLGGALTGSTTIDGAANTLRFNRVVTASKSALFGFGVDNDFDVFVYGNDSFGTANGYTHFLQSPVTISMQRWTSGTLDQRVELSSSGMVVTDDVASKGLEYAADYSANYVNRSLVDKQYVDDAVSGAATTFLDLTDTPSSYSGSADYFVMVNATADGIVFSASGGWVPSTGGTFTGVVTINVDNDYPLIIEQDGLAGTPGTPDGQINRIQFKDSDGDVQGYAGIDGSGNFSLRTYVSGGVILTENSLSVQGNIAVTGTVDGVDVATLESDFNTHTAAVNPHGTDMHDLGDVPAYSGNSLKVPRINSGETAIEWIDRTAFDTGITTDDISEYTASTGVTIHDKFFVTSDLTVATKTKMLYVDPTTYEVTIGDVSAGGAGISFGSDNQIPYTNAAGDDFEYSSSLVFDHANTTLDVTGHLEVANTTDSEANTVMYVNQNPATTEGSAVTFHVRGETSDIAAVIDQHGSGSILHLRDGTSSRFLVSQTGATYARVDGTAGFVVQDSGDSNNNRAILGETSGSGGYLSLYNDAGGTVLIMRSYASSNIAMVYNSPKAYYCMGGSSIEGGAFSDSYVLQIGDPAAAADSYARLHFVGYQNTTSSLIHQLNFQQAYGTVADSQNRIAAITLQTGGAGTNYGNFYFYTADNGTLELSASMVGGGAVTLYHNGSQRLYTTATGIIIPVSGDEFDQMDILDGNINMHRSSTVSAWTRSISWYTDGDVASAGWGAYGADKDTITFLWAGKSYSDFGIAVYPDGAVDLRYNNSKRLVTTSLGVAVHGSEDQAVFRVYAANEDGVRGSIYIDDTGGIAAFYAYDEDDGGSPAYTTSYFGHATSPAFIANNGTIAELYFGANKKLETVTGGIDVTGDLTVSGIAGANRIVYVDAAGKLQTSTELHKENHKVELQEGHDGDTSFSIINSSSTGTSARALYSAQLSAGPQIAMMAYGNAYSSTVWGVTGADVARLYAADASKFLVGTEGATAMGLYTSGTERINIASGGYVGIAGTNTDAQLYVYNNTSNDWAGYFNQDNATAHGLRIDIDATSVSYDIIRAYNGSGEVASLDGTGDWTAGDFILSSDSRLKDVYGYVEDGLEIALALNPSTYRWKDHRDDYIHIGFIAQEVMRVRPELVKTGLYDFLAVSYSKITAINTAAIHGLNRKIDTVEDRLMARIEELEHEVKQLKDARST